MSGILKDAFWRDRERRKLEQFDIDRLRCEVKRLRDVNWDLLAACEAVREAPNAMITEPLADFLDAAIAKARAAAEEESVQPHGNATFPVNFVE